MKWISFIFIFFSTVLFYAQQNNFPTKEFSIEVGLGYNQIHRHLINPDGPLPLGATSIKGDFYFEALHLTPSIRFSYEIQINDNVYVSPFLEYSFIEGKSFDGFESPFSVHTLNLGLLPSYNYKNFQFAGGIRYNYFMEFTDKYADDDFASYSFDYGLRLSYKINDIIISTEGWYNISTLSSTEFEDLYKWNYCRYIFLVGYYF
jgi:hypothetical protein